MSKFDRKTIVNKINPLVNKIQTSKLVNGMPLYRMSFDIGNSQCADSRQRQNLTPLSSNCAKIRSEIEKIFVKH